MCTLFGAIEEHDHRHPLSERKWLDLAAGYRHGFGVSARRDGELIGYAHVWHGRRGDHDEWSVEAVVHPEDRGDDLMARLVDSAVEVCGHRGGGTVNAWFAGPTADDEALLRTRGFAPMRDLYELRRPLPAPDQPALPAGVTVRAFVPGEDDQTWLELNNIAFSEHPEQGRWTEHDLRTRFVQPWFEPEGLLLLEERGGVIGSCWTKRHGHEGMGEIYVIAVLPAEHGRGLGRALTLQGLDSLHRRGSSIGMLYCDADNDVAMRMYQGLGFTIHMLHRAYSLDLATRAADPDRL